MERIVIHLNDGRSIAVNKDNMPLLMDSLGANFKGASIVNNTSELIASKFGLESEDIAIIKASHGLMIIHYNSFWGLRMINGSMTDLENCKSDDLVALEKNSTSIWFTNFRKLDLDKKTCKIQTTSFVELEKDWDKLSEDTDLYFTLNYDTLATTLDTLFYKDIRD